MRLHAVLPACLVLAGCATASGLGGLEGAAFPAAADAAFVPAAAAPMPEGPDAALDRAFRDYAARFPSGTSAFLRTGAAAFQVANPESQGGYPPPPPPSGSSQQQPTAFKSAPTTPGDKKGQGMYLGLGMIFSAGEFDFETPDDFTPPIVPNTEDSSSAAGTGISFRFGFRPAPSFAFEILMDFISYDLTEDPDGFTFDGTVSTFVIGFNGKVYIPIERVEPYVLFGIGVGSMAVDADYNDDGGLIFVSTSGSMSLFNFKFGFGVDVYAVENLAVFFEWSLNLGLGSEAGGRTVAVTTSDIAIGVLFRF